MGIGKSVGHEWRSGASRTLDGGGRGVENYRFWKDEYEQGLKEWRLGQRIRELAGGEDVDIVFEHPERDTFGRPSTSPGEVGPW